jgi:hypothetical protein
MGYSQELAVTMENGQQRPLRSSDLAQQTGMKKPNVDRGMTELEGAGLAARRPIDPSKPLQKGNIAIYSWAVPREPNPDLIIPRDNQIPDWVPTSWTEPTSVLRKFINRIRLAFSPDFLPARDYLSEVETAAREYQKAEDCLTALLKLSAAGNAYKEERNERNIERNNGSSSSAVEVVVRPEEPAVDVQTAEEEEAPGSTAIALRAHPATWERFRQIYPSDHLDGPKAKPLFEALDPKGKRKCIERLQVYLQCPRWLKSPQYIPLASTWLQSAYEEPPPPFYERTNHKQEEEKESILGLAGVLMRRRQAKGEA